MRARGFTIVELGVVVAIVGLMATVAVGSGLGWSAERNRRVVAREGYQLLVTARDVAVAEGRRAVVHFGAERMTAFVELSQPANLVYDAGVDRLLGQFPEMPDGYRAHARPRVSAGFAEVGGERLALFDSRGFLRDAAMQLVDGVLEVEGDSSGEVVRLRVTVGGSVLVE